MKNISVRLPEELDSRLEALVRKSGKSKSEMIRDAVEILCGGNETKNTLSCLDLSGDLAGIINGPKDLSYNKKHMEGYGK